MSNIFTTQQNQTSIVSIKGQIDASNSNKIHTTIMDKIKTGCNSMILDFSEVNYISSAGLRILIYASKTISKKSGNFSICSLSKEVEQIFQVTGLDKILDTYKDLKANLDSFKEKGVL